MEQGQCLMPTGNMGDPTAGTEGKPDASSPHQLFLHKQKDTGQALGCLNH